MSISIEQVSAADAAKRKRERPDEVVLLDCREAGEVEVAAIPGAVHIPMGLIPGRIGELDSSREVIVFCHHGVRSMRVAVFMQSQGFDSVKSMAGGIDAWSATVDQAVPRY